MASHGSRDLSNANHYYGAVVVNPAILLVDHHQNHLRCPGTNRCLANRSLSSFHSLPKRFLCDSNIAILPQALENVVEMYVGLNLSFIYIHGGPPVNNSER